MVPESVMPSYPWLEESYVKGKKMRWNMGGLRVVGVPYTDADIAAAPALTEGKTEMDALVAYLQVLGTMVALDELKTYRE